MKAKLILDIETVPDAEMGRALYGLDGELDDAEVMRAMLHHYQQRTGLDFLPPIQHRVVAIAVVLRNEEGLRPLVLGEENAPEQDLITRFFRGLEHYVPDLVTWNGAAFDLPVLNFRALRHEVQAGVYWETGLKERAFRFNNYMSRFHWRHTDLMDALSGFQGRGRPSLREASALLGLPGKNLMQGSSVMDAHLEGRIGDIRRYCLEDALNTYLVFLHFEFLRGNFTQDNLDEEYGLLIDVLKASGEEHLNEFAGKLEAEPEDGEREPPEDSESESPDDSAADAQASEPSAEVSAEESATDAAEQSQQREAAG
ncbi:3'-5' exonuclease [Candidatus Foliamicus sp.]